MVPDRLEALIGNLTAQLEQLDLGPGEPPNLAPIENQIARLTEKIDASDVRFGNVEMIERGLADVFLQIEEARANTIAADEFKRDLADLRLSQTEADHRTQQALEAVQSTIERLADRLNTVETRKPNPVPPAFAPAPAAPAPSLSVPSASAPSASAPSASAPSASAPSPPPRPMPTALPLPVPIPVAAPEPATQTTPERMQLRPPIGQPRPPIDPTLPADHPLEPGSAPGRGRPITPAERIAASEAALGPIRPSPAPEPTEKANFIAAARRAAQAAAAEMAQAEGNRGGKDAESSAAGGAGGKLGKFKRPLFMSVAAAVLVLGATHITLGMLGSGGPSRVEPARQVASETTAPERTPAPAALARSAAPVPDNRLLMPTPVAKSSTAVAPTAPPAPPAQMPDAKPATAPSPWDLAAINPPAAEVTGSLPRPDTNAAPESTQQAAVPAIPLGPDSLPAAIGSPGLRSAAASGNPAAEYEIAVRYAEGRGVSQSFSEAARWFERAAKQGITPARYRLGSLYEKGHGVKKDLEAARRLYLQAADKGSAKAMHNLAVLFAEGIDGKPDYSAASQWFRKAAAHGVADSQYNLGILYARGIGVEQNLAELYKWFALAAQQGDQDAGRKRDDVAARLDSQSLVAAKLAAQTFAVSAQPEEATMVKSPPGGWDRPAAAAPAAPAPTKPKATPRRTGST